MANRRFEMFQYRQILTQMRVGQSDRQIAKVDLLIIDDFGLKPLRTPQDEDINDLIVERYERHSTIITSNLDLNEWGDAFPNKLQ